MKWFILPAIVLVAFPQLGLASDSGCTMTPAQIDIPQITQRPEVKSYTVDANKRGLTVLLKNGRVVRLVHMGCQHSGAEAALWLESKIPASDVAIWLKEAIALAKIAFSSDISKDVERSLKSGKYEKKITETQLIITASPTEFFSYSIVLSPAEHGTILSIQYSIGG